MLGLPNDVLKEILLKIILIDPLGIKVLLMVSKEMHSRLLELNFGPFTVLGSKKRWLTSTKMIEFLNKNPQKAKQLRLLHAEYNIFLKLNRKNCPLLKFAFFYTQKFASTSEFVQQWLNAQSIQSINWKLYNSFGKNALTDAINSSDMDAVLQLLDNNFNVLEADAECRTALEYSFFNRDPRLYWLLINRVLQVKSYTHTAPRICLKRQVEYLHVDIYFLMDNRVDLGWFVLQGKDETFIETEPVVERLELMSEYLEAVKQGDLVKVAKFINEMPVNFLLKSTSPLIEAVSNGHLELTRLLLDKGASVNFSNQTLIEAVSKDYLLIADLLVEKGADVNDLPDYLLIEWIQQRRFKTITWLLQNGLDFCNPVFTSYMKDLLNSRETVILLLEYGVSPNFKNSAGESLIFFIDDANFCKQLLKMGAKVNISSNNNTSPLMVAAEKNVDLVNVLLESDSGNINADQYLGCTALMYAKNASIVDALMKHGADFNSKDVGGMNALMYYLKSTRVDCFLELLKYPVKLDDCDKRGDSVWNFLLSNTRIEFEIARNFIEKWLISHSVDWRDLLGRTPLLVACSYNYVSVVELLVKKGASVNLGNLDGTTALISATCSSRVQMVDCLLRNGADLELRDCEGRTAFYWAVSYQLKPFIKKLHDAGAQVDCRDSKGNTPLMDHCSIFGCKLLDMLLGMGADINAINNEGKTALMLVTENCNEDAVESLLKAGANPSIRDSSEKTALDYAKETFMKGLVEKLEKARSKVKIPSVFK